MRDLIQKLKEYDLAYRNGAPIISDKEYDDLYFQLVNMEKESGCIYPDSPTQIINYKEVDKLSKKNLPHPMLSLNKTKDIEEIKKYFNGYEYVAMAKMDGLSLLLEYDNYELVSAITRGNGTIGEDVTHNARVISNIPQRINCSKALVMGEIICDKKTFEENFSNEYKHTRNFASGAIRLLNSKESEAKKLKFICWDIIKIDCLDFYNSLQFAKSLGFEVVPNITSLFLSSEEMRDIIKNQCECNNYPIDGLVFRFNDIAYGNSLGNTSHHPKHSLAYKFYDEEYFTSLIDIEWSPSRTGQFNPVAIFDPVEIDGTIIERASLSNVSIMKETLGKPFVGQEIYITKRNAIIPKVERAFKKDNPDNLILTPIICPLCCEKLIEAQSDTDTITLKCLNESCEGKLINQLDHLCSKKGLDIKGLSKATLEKLIEWNWVSCKTDIFKLLGYRDEWIKKDGFGPKSVDKILLAIENAKNTNFIQFISAIGIPNVGQSYAKELNKTFKTYNEFRQAIKDNYDFTTLNTFGPETDMKIKKFDYEEADELSKFINFQVEENISKDKVESNQVLSGLNIVITGSLNRCSRDKYKTFIESYGAKVQNSVNSKTNYLIANKEESSIKYNRALELGIEIINEEYFERIYKIV